jgi:hypothetical protein
MVVTARTMRALVGLFILAPILAAVVICALLLFGVEPHAVFLPGHFVRARLAASGLSVPNAAGVVTTEIVWWAAIVAVWLIVRSVLARGRVESR